MAAKVIYLDNREALVAILDEVRVEAVAGGISSIAVIVCREQGGMPYGRSVYAAIRESTLERDRLVMGAELLKHQLLIEEEEDALALADNDPGAA